MLGGFLFSLVEGGSEGWGWGFLVCVCRCLGRKDRVEWGRVLRNGVGWWLVVGRR